MAPTYILTTSVKLDRPLLRQLLLLPLAAGLIAHSLVFNFVSDDAYISFVYSRNLAEHIHVAGVRCECKISTIRQGASVKYKR